MAFGGVIMNRNARNGNKNDEIAIIICTQAKRMALPLCICVSLHSPNIACGASFAAAESYLRLIR